MTYRRRFGQRFWGKRRIERGFYGFQSLQFVQIVEIAGQGVLPVFLLETRNLIPGKFRHHHPGTAAEHLCGFGGLFNAGLAGIVVGGNVNRGVFRQYSGHFGGDFGQVARIKGNDDGLAGGHMDTGGGGKPFGQIHAARPVAVRGGDFAVRAAHFSAWQEEFAAVCIDSLAVDDMVRAVVHRNDQTVFVFEAVDTGIGQNGRDGNAFVAQVGKSGIGRAGIGIFPNDIRRSGRMIA